MIEYFKKSLLLNYISKINSFFVIFLPRKNKRILALEPNKGINKYNKERLSIKLAKRKNERWKEWFLLCVVSWGEKLFHSRGRVAMDGDSVSSKFRILSLRFLNSLMLLTLLYANTLTLQKSPMPGLW